MKTSSVIGRRFAVLSFGVLLVIGACGGGSGSSARSTTDTLTERQQDSMLSTSRIPGASGVGKAMTAADSASARVRAADTIGP